MNVLLFDRQGGYLSAVVYSLSVVPGLRIGVLAGGSGHTMHSSNFVKYYQTFPVDSPEKDDLAVIAQAIRQFQADVLLPVDEEAVLLVSSHQEALRRLTRLSPVPAVDALQTAVHKYRLHQFLVENQFPNPPTWLLSGGSIDQSRTDAPAFPMIAKPTQGSGGHGIRRLPDQSALDHFLSEASPSDEYILQEIIIGDDVDCSILCGRNRLAAYTIQQPFRPKNSYGYSMLIEFTKNQEVLELVTRLVERLGFNGLAHIDMIRETGTGQIHIVDINVRYWATLLGSTVAGVNFPHLACRLAHDETFPLPDYKSLPFALAKGLVKNWMDVVSGRETERIPFKNSTFPFRLKDPGFLLASLLKRKK